MTGISILITIMDMLSYRGKGNTFSSAYLFFVLCSKMLSLVASVYLVMAILAEDIFKDRFNLKLDVDYL